MTALTRILANISLNSRVHAIPSLRYLSLNIYIRNWLLMIRGYLGLSIGN